MMPAEMAEQARTAPGDAAMSAAASGLVKEIREIVVADHARQGRFAKHRAPFHAPECTYWLSQRIA